MVLFTNDPKEIAKINSLKREAEEAFLAKDYELAISKYTLLHDSLGVDDAALQLNLAHAHYHLGDTAGAKLNYGKLVGSDNKQMKSIALQQLGVMSKDAKKLEEALQQLKSAIKADPSNQEAIYNYEVVKKLLEEQKQQEQQQQDQQNKEGEDKQEQQQDDQKKQDGDQENQENQDGENRKILTKKIKSKKSRRTKKAKSRKVKKKNHKSR